jgi:hypothetical protein
LKFDPLALRHTVSPVHDSVHIECPHCGETFGLAVDVSEGSAEFTVDCEVCCRPMVVSVRVADGEISGVDVAAD